MSDRGVETATIILRLAGRGKPGGAPTAAGTVSGCVSGSGGLVALLGWFALGKLESGRQPTAADVAVELDLIQVRTERALATKRCPRQQRRRTGWVLERFAVR